jgi:hypothetical protein
MKAIRKRDLEKLSTAAYRTAESLAWDDIAERTLEVYQY